VERSPRLYQENEACGILTESFIVKTTGSVLGEGHTETHLRVEMFHGRSMKLPNQELGTCEKAPTRTRGEHELLDILRKS